MEEIKTKNNYLLDEVISALQKSIRRGKEFEAMYWAIELVESGYEQYLWRRLCVIAVEDIGLADENAVILVNACANIWERIRSQNKVPENNIIALAILKLCRARKNREADDFVYFTEIKRKEGLKLEMPDIAIDCHTKKGKEKLRKIAEKNESDYNRLVNEMFYYSGAKLNNPIIIENNKWAKELMKELKLSYSKYYGKKRKGDASHF